jgi:hypothetical protein
MAENENKLTEVMITINPGGKSQNEERTIGDFEREILDPITQEGSKGVDKLKGIVKGLKERPEITLEKDWDEIATSISNAFNKNMSRQIVERAKQEGPGFWKRFDSALDTVARVLRKTGGKISRSQLVKFFKESFSRRKRAFEKVKQAHEEAQEK